ncbi:MAG: hypothetical protein HOP13_09175 [Alphaproteobacteria bacterium]|nr:hypothetical protein [Alphaproteobacteria bacterium]
MAQKTIAAAALILAATATIAFAKTQARVSAEKCPSITILSDATRITQMDGTKIDLKAEIRDPALACSVTGATASSKLSFWVKSAIAPTSDIAPRSVPYFVAVIANGEVIAKEVFDLKLNFTSDRMLKVKESVAKIEIPIAAGKEAQDYAVTIGFQLTEAQAAYNRTASR